MTDDPKHHCDECGWQGNDAIVLGYGCPTCGKNVWTEEAQTFRIAGKPKILFSWRIEFDPIDAGTGEDPEDIDDCEKNGKE